MKDTPMIVCPTCGQEYLPVEVFIPEAFFGNPKEIMKSDSGKVDFVVGDGMDLSERFICEGCNTKLKINAELTFNVEVDDSNSAEEEYISSFNKPKKIKLSEVDLFET